MTIQINRKPELKRTAGGAMGWVVGTVDGRPWVAYERKDIARMRRAMKGLAGK